ncbi:TPA: gamma-glutamyl-gamma-aminobutyrate hydrolase family protein [Candidatus Ventrenecus stercoripullorum]|nr:gamma-glutamyl-gamma-aminobutyrate hydrolase family protein [Candidatus Ventrenecus stercoripullorum]
MSKVIVGIVAKYRDGDENQKIVDSRIRNEIKQAVFDNGGIAIGIISPNNEIQPAGDDWMKYNDLIDKENIIRQIKLCDGIILQGGNANEAYEPFIAKYCYDNDIPCLGICAGQNSIVRGLGGTTYKISNPEKHNQPSKEYVHSVHIDTSSKFYNIVKVAEIMVNSRHKRTVGNCLLLDKVGFCEDGYADIVESKDKTFYIGVRFHPESLYKVDENMNNIFKKFIESCKK